MNDNTVYQMAINTFGAEAQERQAIEEMAELIIALNHKHRGREHNVEEEIADCEIMLEQLKIINNAAEVERIKKLKLQRLFDRVCDKCF